MEKKILSDGNSDSYYDSIAKGYNELYAEEQLEKLEFIGKELKNNIELKDFVKKNDSLLDVGCGTGISTAFFNCKNKTGIDPSKKILNIAKNHYPTIDFKELSAEKISFKNNSFDIVVSLTAIQNFSEVKKGLSEIKRVGKKRFILTFLKKSPKSQSIDSLIREMFSVKKFLVQEKDNIYFCE
jgi:ubiquinone/menaquinone biosynthesis C-methylase UbiE